MIDNVKMHLINSTKFKNSKNIPNIILVLENINLRWIILLFGLVRSELKNAGNLLLNYDQLFLKKLYYVCVNLEILIW